MRQADERKGKIYEKSVRKNKIRPATAEIYGDSEVEFTFGVTVRSTCMVAKGAAPRHSVLASAPAAAFVGSGVY